MASAPSDPTPILGRVDRDGRLVAADAQLAALQAEAGSRVGAELALPQVAAIARLARRLGVPVSRPATAAGADYDVELWVRATPEGEEVSLSIERWSVVPPAGPRLGGLVMGEAEPEDPAGSSREWLTDAELRLTEISPELATKLRIDPATAVGQPLTRLFRLDEDENGEMPLLVAVAARGSFAGQRAHTRAAGAVELILSGAAVVGADGRFAGFKGTADPVVEAARPRQVTPINAIDDVLDQALRSPLDRIIDSADRIADRAEGPLRSDYASYATDISTAARHLLSVIGAMGGTPSTTRESVDLAKLATEAAGLLEPTAEAKDVQLIIDLAGPMLAYGEQRGVVQVLVNLIGNAVRHSPERKPVRITAERQAGNAVIHVADSGPGIDPADQQRIFERFEQASSDQGGAGLGLAISRRLARSMGGEIELVSAPGHGARFSLSLPAA